MLNQNNLIVILYSLPVYQLLFYTIQLITFRKIHPARKYLGMMFLAMTSFLIINALFHLEYNIPLFEYVFLPLLLMLLPFKFLYLLSLFQKFDEIKGLRTYILFLPSVLVLLAELMNSGIALIVQQVKFSVTGSGSLYKAVSDNNIFLNAIRAGFLIIIITQILIAALRIARLIKSEKESMQVNPKQFAHINLRWIYIISFSLLTFILTCTVFIFVLGSSNVYSAGIFNALVLLSGGIAGYYGLKQDALMREVANVGSLKASFTTTHMDPGTKSGMDMPDEEIAEIIAKIRMLMEDEKPYLLKSLNINDLSKQTEVRRQKLTMVINIAMGTNFNGLINDYRIQEAIRILEDDTHNYTIDAIADMAGFHSRSTFYACFKKYTGKTPKEFLMERASGSNARPNEVQLGGE